VESVTPMGDPVAKTYRVRFDLPEDTPLMIGMSVEVNVVTAVRRRRSWCRPGRSGRTARSGSRRTAGRSGAGLDGIRGCGGSR
jgi:hypothetical protein